MGEGLTRAHPQRPRGNLPQRSPREPVLPMRLPLCHFVSVPAPPGALALDTAPEIVPGVPDDTADDTADEVPGLCTLSVTCTVDIPDEPKVPCHLMGWYTTVQTRLDAVSRLPGRGRGWLRLFQDL